MSNLRIGHGYDAHRFAPNRPLILGGVTIPHHEGLLGHSDADVLLHALMDAMLGAAALGDIGTHFPDSDEAYRGADSMQLLSRVKTIIAQKGYTLQNADITVIAQAPKLAPHLSVMRRNIAVTLGVSTDDISVKATTTEKMGFEGRQEGISCHAVCLLTKTD